MKSKYSLWAYQINSNNQGIPYLMLWNSCQKHGKITSSGGKAHSQVKEVQVSVSWYLQWMFNYFKPWHLEKNPALFSTLMNNLCQLTVVVKMPTCYVLGFHSVECIRMMDYEPEKVILWLLKKRLDCLSDQSNHLGPRIVKGKDKTQAGRDLCKSWVQLLSQM